MHRANSSDKATVVEILSTSFADNQSVKYIVKQDSKKVERVRNLVAYSFEICMRFGEVWVSDDRTGCALVLFPEKKKFSLKSVMLDFNLVVNCMGFANLGRAIRRESKIKARQPNERLYYLWFVGVHPQAQHRGTGTALMNGIIAEAQQHQRLICLETSTLKNIPWYQRFGVEVYAELDLGYKLYFLRKR